MIPVENLPSANLPPDSITPVPNLLQVSTTPEIPVANLPHVSLIPVANLPPVTPAANLPPVVRLGLHTGISPRI
jgi:hypothetical protein